MRAQALLLAAEESGESDEESGKAATAKAAVTHTTSEKLVDKITDPLHQAHASAAAWAGSLRGGDSEAMGEAGESDEAGGFVRPLFGPGFAWDRDRMDREVAEERNRQRSPRALVGNSGALDLAAVKVAQDKAAAALPDEAAAENETTQEAATKAKAEAEAAAKAGAEKQAAEDAKASESTGWLAEQIALGLSPSSEDEPEPEPETVIEPLQAEVQTLVVVCPDGVGPGELLVISTEDGSEHEVAVPDGTEPGDEFVVEVSVEGATHEVSEEVEQQVSPAGEISAATLEATPPKPPLPPSRD